MSLIRFCHWLVWHSVLAVLGLETSISFLFAHSSQSLSFLRRPTVLKDVAVHGGQTVVLFSTLNSYPPILTAIVGASGVWIPESTSHLPMFFQTRLCQPVGIAAESLILEPELIKAADQLLLWPLPWRVARARGSSPRFCFPHPAAIQPRISSYRFSYLNMGAIQPFSVFSLPLTSYLFWSWHG